MRSAIKILCLSLIFFAISLQASARPMITDLSERKIHIDAKFVGKELLLYGARVEAGDIVVVIRGPQDNYVVRKKEDIGGIWINTKSVEFENVPQFYLVASSRKFTEIEPEVLRKKLGIGFDTIQLKGTGESASTELNEFQGALLKKLEADGLLNSEVLTLPLLEGTLFRIRVRFPEKIVSGIYTAEIYSFNDGELRGVQSIPVKVKKVGVEAFIYRAAHEHPATYGLFAIFLAVIMGWIAAALFRKV